MNSDTALDVFRLFNMSNKTEEQIMAMAESAMYLKEVCRAAVPFLKMEKHILRLMLESFCDEETYNSALKSLKLESWSENKILAFFNKFPEGKARDAVKKASIPFFKLTEKKEYQIINLFKKVQYDYYFRDACISALNLSEKSDEELQSIIELSDFEENICRAAIKHFKDEENILLLMERKETPDMVLNAGAKCIKWEGKNDDKVMHILKRGRYNLSLCEAGLSSLKQVSDILFIMEKGNYYNSICEIGIPLLKLEQKHNDELYQIMKESKYCYHVCNACLSRWDLSRQSKGCLLEIMQKTEYNPYVCMSCIKFIKDEDAIVKVLAATRFQVGVCRVALTLLTDPDNISQTMSLTEYDADVCEVGVTLLKDEKQIFDIMEKTNFDDKVCAAGVKTLTAIKERIQKNIRKRQ